MSRRMWLEKMLIVFAVDLRRFDRDANRRRHKKKTHAVLMAILIIDCILTHETANRLCICGKGCGIANKGETPWHKEIRWMARSELPPLAALRAFEAAARHKNFTQAAAELGMTQAAVSYQIKVLEDRVGHPLFLRQARGVALTAIGTALSEQASIALDTIADAFAEARGRAHGVLALSVIPTFATSFLAKRLGGFQLQHPNVAVRVEVSETVVDFRATGFDAAIRGGRGDWPGLVAHKLVDTRFSPMLSPGLADSIGGLKTPRDLLKLPILAHADPWWRAWFSAAGVPEVDFGDRPSQQFGPQVLEATAAMAGQGVAMLTPALFSDALESGQLIQPFDLTCEDGSAYWLVYPHAFRNTPKIKLFRSWLTREIPVLSGGDG